MWLFEEMNDFQKTVLRCRKTLTVAEFNEYRIVDRASQNKVHNDPEYKRAYDLMIQGHLAMEKKWDDLSPEERADYARERALMLGPTLWRRTKQSLINFMLMTRLMGVCVVLRFGIAVFMGLVLGYFSLFLLAIPIIYFISSFFVGCRKCYTCRYKSESFEV